MDATYNFFLTELIDISDDNELLDGFIDVMVEMGISLEVKFLNDVQFGSNTYAEQRELLNKALEAKRHKLKYVRAMDFESAVFSRNKERELLEQIEAIGFNLYSFNEDEFVNYHVDVDRNRRLLSFIVNTNSSSFVALLEDIKRRVERSGASG